MVVPTNNSFLVRCQGLASFLPCESNRRSANNPSDARNCDPATASSGYAFPASGQTGVRRWLIWCRTSAPHPARRFSGIAVVFRVFLGGLVDLPPLVLRFQAALLVLPGLPIAPAAGLDHPVFCPRGRSAG